MTLACESPQARANRNFLCLLPEEDPVKSLKTALLAASLMLAPLAAVASMPMADSRMDDMTAAPGAPID